MDNGKRVAVIFRIDGNARVVCGRATYDEDRDLGRVLRIELEPDRHELAGQTTLFFREESLQGRLDVGDRYGCDLRVDLGLLTAQCERSRNGNRRKVAGKLCASA